MMRTSVALLAVLLVGTPACSDKHDKEATKTVELPKSGRATASAVASASSAVVVTSTASATASTSAPAAVTSASTPASAAAPPSGWPLDPLCVMDGKMSRCKTSEGGPGVQCGTSPCRNLCPAGMAPNGSGTFCEKLCTSPADCGASGRCTPEGVCDTFPTVECQGTVCELPGGDFGLECNGKCVNPCKRGLTLYGGTHCAKRCKAPSDCPGGECAEEGFCTPVCPAEGCPYPWE